MLPNDPSPSATLSTVTSVVPLALLLWGIEQDALWAVRWGDTWLHALVLPYAVSGCLMVSRTLRIPKP